jgi:hypothetical protein
VRIPVPGLRRTNELITTAFAVPWGVGIPIAAWLWVLTVGTGPRFESRFLCAVVLQAAIASVLAAWVVMALLGRIGTWTGAGFRLVVLGFVGWWFATFLADFDPLVAMTEDAGPVGGALAMLWLVRNTALVAVGLGLGLVLAYSAVDLRRRRRSPAWTHGPD